MVGAITVTHALLEATEILGEHEALAFVPVSFYLVPVLYGGLYFTLEGALLTALWSGLLAIPNAVIWHDSPQRAGELFQLAALIIVAVVVAQRVEREGRAKVRAEQVGFRLAQLNATAAAASHSLEPCKVVTETLDAILDVPMADLAWISFGPGYNVAHTFSIVSRPAGSISSLPESWEQATKIVVENGRPWLDEPPPGRRQSPQRAGAMVVPIRAADELIGALGLGCSDPDSCLSVEDLSLLDAVAHQLAVALDNSRHYQEARAALEELAAAQENLQSYLRLATDAQEEERKRLARELHDDTIQSLVVIKATLDAMAAGLHGAGPSRVRLDSVKQMVEACVDEVRRFSRDLRPSILDDLGLVHAVDWLIADMGRRTNIRGRLAVEGEPRRFNVATELAVFRITQEALRNVERHSGASVVRVALTFTPAGLIASVEDDGSGFDLRKVLGRRDNDVPLGLIGMQERAKLAGGSLAIVTKPREGTTITVTLDAPE